MNNNGLRNVTPRSPLLIVNCQLSIWGGSEPELLQFKQTARLYLTYTLRELGSSGMLVQGLLTLPGLADHEDILARGTLKDIVGHASLMLLTLGREQHGSLQGFVVLPRLGLEETIQSYHIASLLKVRSSKKG